MADERKTVKVEALQYHTYEGHEYQVGDTYDIDEQYADSVAAQGKAVRVDRAAVAQAARAEADKPREGASPSTSVGPMQTRDMDVTHTSTPNTEAPLAGGKKTARTPRAAIARAGSKKR